MPEAIGNIPVPGTSTVAEYKPKEILASYSPPPYIKGRTIKAAAAAIPAGTVMARETATKKWVPYVNAGAGGLGVALGVLLEDMNTIGADKLGNIVFKGQLKLSQLVGLDAGAITALNGRSDTASDVFMY